MEIGSEKKRLVEPTLLCIEKAAYFKTFTIDGDSALDGEMLLLDENDWNAPSVSTIQDDEEVPKAPVYLLGDLKTLEGYDEAIWYAAPERNGNPMAEFEYRHFVLSLVPNGDVRALLYEKGKLLSEYSFRSNTPGGLHGVLSPYVSRDELASGTCRIHYMDVDEEVLVADAANDCKSIFVPSNNWFEWYALDTRTGEEVWPDGEVCSYVDVQDALHEVFNICIELDRIVEENG